mmetsp:Transcript_8829/g.21119  ORF Transcript_8829/g.21119 Transcript_8829/m.21119 type:complete len:181 (-) Transcript_8829:181-723(-)|eukprot:CAMPEP_0113632548 /NCGR_PEP_ID=MMETSP0017_2-20120614/16921_1 /TAXON_ID=2856 /ORGANISM="Cylindrotheca closterium" /LENGTH=180 /DNA_ID=CAMNT_0000543115 /DNA_START=67 /DNA_END=609 /DNA_ORIENTATION=+ /assembly_acc=CAM_ASM_000147
MKLTSALVVASLASASAFAPISSQTSTSNTALEASSRREWLSSAATIAALGIPTLASAASRPTYLVDPTEEFKINEAKAMEFKRQQLLIKKDFATVLDRLTAEPNDEEALVKDLAELKLLVAKTGGLPLGIKKEDVFKIIRAKKAKGFWPTAVEYAYQKLISEISFQQSPNLEKDMGSPY